MTTASPYAAPMDWLNAESMLRRPMTHLQLRGCGQLPAGHRPRVAVIGARRASASQLGWADRLTGWLAESGAVIVSGGALGIDAAAHEATLRRGGTTIAVLPGGLRRPSPSGHLGLYRRMVAGGGLLLSPFDDDVVATVPAFHRRNAVICHLVDALVVVCADGRGGSVQCSRRAHGAGVPLYATPWSPGSPNSVGSNRILATVGRAIASEADVQGLLQAIAAGPTDGGLRAPQLPLPGGPAARDGGPSRRRESARTIDAEGRGRQTCAALEVPAGSKLESPPESEAGLVAAISALLDDADADGVSLEEAARALCRERGQVAETLLALGMSGQVRKTAGGRYRRTD